MKIKAIVLYGIILASVLSSLQCNLRKAIAPSWDTQINFPLINHPYTLDTLIRKDTSIVQKNPTNGFLTYSFSHPAIFDSVGDKIKMKPQQPAPFGISIGAIPFNLNNFLLNIPNPGIPSGFPIPATPLPSFSVLMDSSTQFDYVEFDSGTVSFQLTNNLPIKIYFSQPIQFRDIENNIIGPFNVDALNANQSVLTSASLIGKRVRNRLSLDSVRWSTSGSAGTPVTIPSVVLGVNLSFSNILIKSARAKIPATNVLRNVGSVFTPDTSSNATKFKIVRFKNGGFDVKLRNDLDVTTRLNVLFPQLKNRISGASYQLDTSIARRDSALFTFDLSNTYEINAPDTTNIINYTAIIRQLGSTDDTAGYRIFNQADKVEVSLLLHQPPNNIFSVQYFEGVIKPTTVTFDTLINVKLGDLPSKFSVDSLCMPDAKFILKLYSPGIQSRVGGNILLNNDPSYIINIPQTLLTGNDTTDVVLSGTNVVSTLTRFVSVNKNLPKTFFLNSTATINPNYTIGTIADTDKISGRVVFDIPANIGIKGGVVRDTVRFGDEKDDKGNKVKLDSTMLNRLLNGNLSFMITNGIPVTLRASIIFLRSDFVAIDTLPGSGPIYVGSAQIGTDGFSSTPEVSQFDEPLDKSEIDNVNRAKFCVLEIRIDTPPTSPAVKFRSSDMVKVRIFGNFNYRVEE
jgi:hypothetical protein